MNCSCIPPGVCFVVLLGLVVVDLGLSEGAGPPWVEDGGLKQFMLYIGTCITFFIITHS